MYYVDWNDVPNKWDSWPLKYFTPQEIACKGTGKLFVNMKALSKLDHFRSVFNKPIKVSSAYRSPYHNAQVGGAPKSYHVKGEAFDIVLGGYDKSDIIKFAKLAGFTGLGVNYRTFVHVDTGRRRQW